MSAVGVTERGAPPTSERTFVRGLSWFDGFALSLAVPAAVLASLGYSISSLGALGAAALWGVSAVIAVLQNYLFAELAGMFPNKPGGIALYAHEAWKKYCAPLGAVAAWGYWMGWSLGLAVNGLLIGSLIQSQWFPHATWSLWDGLVHVGLPQLIAAAAIIVVWLLNVFGIRPAVRVNYVLGFLTVAVFAIFMFVPFLSGNFHGSLLTSQIGAPGHAWGGAKLAIVWLFVMGWSVYATEMCATFAPEYKNPKRDTNMALRAAGLFGLVVFVLMPLGTAGTVGEAAVKANPVSYFVAVFEQLIGHAGGFVVFVLCAGIFVAMNSNTADASRALYGIAKDRMIIRQLDHLNKHHMPGRAMAVDLIANLALVFCVGNIIGVLFASNIGYFVCIILSVSAFVLLRKDRPNAERPIRRHKIWIPVAVLLTLANTVMLLVGITNPGLAGYGGFSETLVGLGLLSISVVLWLIRVWQDGGRIRVQAPSIVEHERPTVGAEN
jgi:amino acid transporter